MTRSSPIIYLSSLGDIGILKTLLGKFLAPVAVKREVVSSGKGSYGFKEISEEKGIKEKEIKNKSAKNYLLTDIHEGEAEVIVLSEEVKANLIIMDDRLGREIAKLRGLNVIGTLRLLVIAKNKGIIPDVKSRISKLKEIGFGFKKMFTIPF